MLTSNGKYIVGLYVFIWCGLIVNAEFDRMTRTPRNPLWVYQGLTQVTVEMTL